MLDDTQIQAIIDRVMREVGQNAPPPPPPEPARRKSNPGYGAPEPETPGQHGVFATLDEAVAAAEAAFRRLDALPLTIRKDMVAHMRQAAREYATVLAEMAHSETGMGRVEDKTLKNILNADKTQGPEALETEAWSGDHGLTITEYAPYGVIGALTPSTNPTSTVICNAIAMVSAGNAVVFNAHPSAKGCANTVVQILNQAIQKAGGPPNLLACVADPTLESATALMHHAGIRLLVVTGGIGVVRAAMQSGKRAVCAGPGNPPVVVDETADVEQAGRDVVVGGSFDNNIVCTTEKETFAVDAICDQLIEVMTRHGAVKINSWQFERLWKIVTVKSRGPGKPADMNKEFIGKNAGVLLREIGISAGPEARQIVVEVDRDHPVVWSEQMMPIMPVVRVRSADEGIDLAVAAEHGFRHTAVMHSKNLDNLSRMARVINCSIFVKNGPNLAGLGYGGEGYCSFTIASPTGEGLTGPRSFSRLRRCALIDAFRIV
ncbi:MAG: aldehyde dehydrogenase EutE [Chloroflexi bacterium]|nr:aldehyde dehydrogenase EutE [Chloroflexota bacterium]MCI0578466.1 aldehyde dehydrogenase EutE [Chloroflexota bacterium]MCI0643912.1 aldehyde dehydrogenase EutE [Chloroflexota bacterium]MCI0729178.1 aldehyde dehydrogenase EutE [Chloroflexota bacterium]